MPEKEQKREEVNPQQAFIENWQKMNMIIQAMRETPALSDVKREEENQDVFPLTKVEFPEEGGILTYMEGQEYPYRGFPYFEFVETMDKIKKIVKGMVSGIYHNIYKGNKAKLLTFLSIAWAIKRIFYAGVYTFYRLIERFKIKPIRYCQAIRELYRAFSIERKDEKPKIKELRIMLRELMCMILEFDNAYRFRFQDLMEEFNKENFKKSPIKELNRLIDIAISREKTQELKDMWTLMKMGLLYLKIDKKLEKMLVDVFSQIDLEKVKLTIEDKSYCRPRKDYSFGFMQK
uniref:Uncharacterized protein n=1 Tax=candidate division CPR3 bacterium TaxID=2268181 RepID=A0A7V3JAA4_UNCC3